MLSIFGKIGRFLKRRWWVMLLLGILGGGAAWYWYTRTQQAQEPVQTQAVQRRDIQKTLSFSGEVDAAQRALLRFATPGKLVYSPFRDGDAVKKGQVIASLDRRSAQKTLDKSLSLYQTERWDYENAEDLRENRWLNDREQRGADQDQFALDRSVIDVQLQSLVIEQYSLSAPFSGVLVSVPSKSTGVVLTTADSYQMVNPETLYFSVFVDETDIDQVKVGQTAEIRLDAYAGESYRAVVDRIAYTSSEGETGTVFKVELRFLDTVSLERQRLGMNGEAALFIDERVGVLSIPVDAVKSRNGTRFVEIPGKKGKPEERTVELGLESQDYAEVLSGLSEGEVVIVP